VREVFRVLLVAKVLEGIRPEEVAHRSERRWLFEPVQLKQQVNIDRISRRKLSADRASRFERDCPRRIRSDPINRNDPLLRHGAQLRQLLSANCDNFIQSESQAGRWAIDLARVTTREKVNSGILNDRMQQSLPRRMLRDSREVPTATRSQLISPRAIHLARITRHSIISGITRQ